MAFDGFITKAVISELNNQIIGAKINKVFEPNKNEIIIGLYNNSKNYLLNICTNPEFCRINLTTHTKQNPQNAYNFCMLLRKYLIGGKIKSISTFDLERTIEICLDCYNDFNELVTRKLFVEIMSRQSNIILTNDKNIIIDTLKHFDNNVRELLPAHEYTMVQTTKHSFLNLTSFDAFYEISKEYIQNKISLTNLFTKNFIGFSKPLIKEALTILNIIDTNYSSTDLQNLYNYFKQLINNFGTPNIYCRKNEKNDYTIVLNNRLNSSYTLSENSLNINNFLDDYYFYKETNSIFITSRNNLLKIVSTALKKVYKKLENINTKLKECENLNTYRLYGELLTANLYKLNSSNNLSEITLENYYDNNSLITIPLDKSISIHKNIDKYFKKYNKLKNASIIVTEQKKETEKELSYIESIVFNLSNSKNLNDLTESYEEISENIITKKIIASKKQSAHSNNKNTQRKINLEFIEFDNYTIYIGKNNIQNDYISLRFSNPNDIWFHTQKIHGSHILLKNSENLDITDIPENVLFKCACLAKENSKASNAVNVCVDYCYARYVKKVHGAKPGMVIYNNFKTIIVK